MRNFLFMLVLLCISLFLTGCNTGSLTDSGDKEISLVVFDDPVYKKIGDVVKDEVEKQGYEIKIIYMNDIVQPNKVVENKEAFANYFQHTAYLEQFKEDHGTDVVSAFGTFVDLGGLYSTKHKSIKDIPKGAIVSIPVDPANNGRALFMLQKEGLLKLRGGVDVVHASTKDIIENPLELKFKEVDQLMLGRTLEDVDSGFMFTANAVGEGFTEDQVLVQDDEKEAIEPYTLLVCVRPENKDSEKTEVLRKAFQNDRVKKVLEENYPRVITAW